MKWIKTIKYMISEMDWIERLLAMPLIVVSVLGMFIVNFFFIADSLTRIKLSLFGLGMFFVIKIANKNIDTKD